MALSPQALAHEQTRPDAPQRHHHRVPADDLIARAAAKQAGHSFNICRGLCWSCKSCSAGKQTASIVLMCTCCGGDAIDQSLQARRELALGVIGLARTPNGRRMHLKQCRSEMVG